MRLMMAVWAESALLFYCIILIYAANSKYKILFTLIKYNNDQSRSNANISSRNSFHECCIETKVTQHVERNSYNLSTCSGRNWCKKWIPGRNYFPKSRLKANLIGFSLLTKLNKKPLVKCWKVKKKKFKTQRNGKMNAVTVMRESENLKFLMNIGINWHWRQLLRRVWRNFVDSLSYLVRFYSIRRILELIICRIVPCVLCTMYWWWYNGSIEKYNCSFVF